MSHWPYVFGAYAFVAVVLVAYWRRVEGRLRALANAPEGRQ